MVSHTMSDLRASEDQGDDDTQSLDKRLSHDSVSDAADDVMTTEVLELQDKEDECAVLSPLQTPTMEHIISTPKISNEKFLLASGNVSALAESKLQDQQDPLAQTPCMLSDTNYEPDNDLFKSPEGKITLLGSDLQDLEKVEKEIQEIGSHIKDQEDDLKWSLLLRDELKEDLAQLEVAIEELPQPVSQLDCRSQKEVVLDNIENKESAAAIYSIASRKVSTDVIGIAVLLATTPDPRLSRSLSEYLGEDQMLAVVCQSNASITMPETYENVLNALAGELGRSMTGRQLIICLEDTRQVITMPETYENVLKCIGW